ncbi:MAG: hypothetical protein MJA31_18630 [Clostridia bacterium]|nr:hypothetical protein [Clostridia bacterium]
MNILVIEASSSAAKTAIYNKKDGIIHIHSVNYSKDISNIKNQNPEGIIQTVLQAVKEILQDKSLTINFIALASVWHSLLYLDDELNPVSDIKTWADVDGASTARKYREKEILRSKIYKNTGCNIHSKYPAWKYMHDKEQNLLPLKGEIKISSLPEYLFQVFTGERVVSRSSASGTGFLNIHTLDWDKETLDLLGLRKDQFSKIVEIDYTGKLGEEIAKELNIPIGTKVLVPSGDGALNQIGENGLTGEVMTISIGTSGAIRMAADEPILPDSPATWCYYIGDEKRIVGAATSGAGNCVQWFKELFDTGELTFEKLEKTLSKVNLNMPDNLPIFLPFISGEQSPGWNDDKSGSFCNLKIENRLGDIYFSVLAGIIFNLYQNYLKIIEIDKEPKKIVLSGGITNSKYWLQMAANIFNKDIYVSTVEHSSILGALKITRKVTNEIKSICEIDQKEYHIVQPNIQDVNAMKLLYKKYLQFYELVK